MLRIHLYYIPLKAHLNLYQTTHFSERKKKSEKMRLDDSCELSAKMIHIKCQALFSQEKNVCCSKWRFKGLFLGI